jgi:hypothetical protein
MAKTLAQIMAKFTPEEQAEIQAQADQLITAEMTLRMSRKNRHSISDDDDTVQKYQTVKVSQ